jgi:hypothetical protein
VAEPDPVKTAETLVAMAEIFSAERPALARRKPAKAPAADVKGADR